MFSNNVLVYICCCCSVAQSRPPLCNPMDCSTPDFPVHHHLPEPTQTHIHHVGDAIQPFHPLSPTSPALYLSIIRVFSNESALRIRWPKYWSFSFNISPSNERPGLISFRNGLVGPPCSPRDSQEFAHYVGGNVSCSLGPCRSRHGKDWAEVSAIMCF